MRPGYAILAVPLVSGALALVWWAPWSSSPDPVARAREAFGNRPVVHIVAQLNIGLGASATRPVVGKDVVEMWYDGSRQRLHVFERRDGRVTADLATPSGRLRRTRALVVFALKYRLELADGALRNAGADIVQNRHVVWLRSPTLRVAIDPVSYQPLWLRSVSSADPTGPLTQFVLAETVPFDPHVFLTRRQKKARHL